MNTHGQLFENIVEEFYASNGFELCSDVVCRLQTAIEQGDHVRKLLKDTAEELDEWHYNSSIAKVVGSSAGIAGVIAGVGGTVAAVGIFLSPVTGGLSLIGTVAGGIVAGVGGTVTVAGTGTVVGTQIVNWCHNNSLLEKAQEAINEYSKCRDRVGEAWQRVQSMCHTISIKVKSFGVEAILNFVWQIYSNGKDCISITEIAKKLKNIASKKIPVYIALGAIIAGTGVCTYNLYELVTSAKVIHKKEPHPAAEEIRNKTITDLGNEMEKLQTIKTSLENKCNES